MDILKLSHVSYQYPGTTKTVLHDMSVSFQLGRIYAIVGPSGAGKSTLLSLLAGLDVATEGEMSYNGKDLKTVDRDDYRAKDVGVIFQSYNLLKNVSALDNILLSMNISGIHDADNKEKALNLLAEVGISKEDAMRKVLKLSGGEQQRVSIARALSHNPQVMIADEPTGNLDEKNQTMIAEILRDLAHEGNRCVIVVTHSADVAAFADQIYTISAGSLIVE